MRYVLALVLAAAAMAVPAGPAVACLANVSGVLCAGSTMTIGQWQCQEDTVEVTVGPLGGQPSGCDAVDVNVAGSQSGDGGDFFDISVAARESGDDGEYFDLNVAGDEGTDHRDRMEVTIAGREDGDDEDGADVAVLSEERSDYHDGIDVSVGGSETSDDRDDLDVSILNTETCDYEDDFEFDVYASNGGCPGPENDVFTCFPSNDPCALVCALYPAYCGVAVVPDIGPLLTPTPATGCLVEVQRTYCPLGPSIALGPCTEDNVDVAVLQPTFADDGCDTIDVSVLANERNDGGDTVDVSVASSEYDDDRDFVDVTAAGQEGQAPTGAGTGTDDDDFVDVTVYSAEARDARDDVEVTVMGYEGSDDGDLVDVGAMQAENCDSQDAVDVNVHVQKQGYGCVPPAAENDGVTVTCLAYESGWGFGTVPPTYNLNAVCRVD